MKKQDRSYTEKRREIPELSGEQYRSIVEQINDALYIHDFKGNIFFCNENAVRMTGYSREELIGANLSKIDSTTIFAKFPERIKVLKKEGAILFEGEHIRKDGVLVPVEISVKLVSQEGAGLVHSFVRDISERRRTETALLQSEADFKELFDNAPVGYHELDTAGRIVRVNRTELEMLGHTSEEMLGQYIWKFVLEAERTEATVKAKLAGKLPPSSGDEYIFQRKDGKAFPVLIEQRFLHDPEGRIKGIRTVIEDITERKQAEEALRESEARFAALSEAAFEGIVLMDKGRIFDCNEQLVKMIGCERSQIIGRDVVNDFVAPESREAVLQHIRSGSEEPYEHFSLRYDGARYPVETRGKSIPYKGQQMRVTAIRDITERKRAEEEILKLNTDLEQRIAERTAHLEAANLELEAFAYSISHDLRTPLRHINGFVNLLHERLTDQLDTESKEDMETVVDATNHMGALIDDLLSFSRMGRQEMSKAKVDLGELVKEVIHDLKAETDGRKIEWRIAKLSTVTGDRAMLRIVLFNLLANAVKYTRPRPAARIEIGLGKGEKGETVIFVRDNGVGFDMQYADKLFGVFQRLHRIDEFEGTGIGLANVRRIISRHGGRTWAEGEVDKGATFHFSLPKEEGGDRRKAD